MDTKVGPVGITEEGADDALPVVCLHGLPGSTRDFRYLAPLLARCFRVIRVDMPGFASSPPGTIGTMAQWARVPEAVADALGIGRFGLVAHSFGGGAGILAAARAGERCALLGLMASVGARRHRAYAWPRTVVRLLLMGTWLPGVRGRLMELARAQYRRLRLPLPADLRELRRDLRLMASLDFRAVGHAARQVTCRTLVAWALDDPLVEPAIGRELVERIPRATAMEFEEGGHHLQKTRANELGEALCRLVRSG